MPAEVVSSASTMVAPPSRRMERTVAGELGHAPFAPIGAQADDTIVVRGSAPQRQARRGREKLVHEQSGRIERDLGARRLPARVRRGEAAFGRTDWDLGPADFEPFGGPGTRRGGSEPDGQPRLAGLCGGRPAGGHDRSGRARADLGHGQVAGCNLPSVRLEAPCGPQPGQVGEVLPVGQFDRARPGRLGRCGDLDRSRDLAVLEEGRLGRAIGPDQAVQAEVAVVGGVSEIAPVGPALCAVGKLLNEAVVPPLPDEAAL